MWHTGECCNCEFRFHSSFLGGLLYIIANKGVHNLPSPALFQVPLCRKHLWKWDPRLSTYNPACAVSAGREGLSKWTAPRQQVTRVNRGGGCSKTLLLYVLRSSTPVRYPLSAHGSRVTCGATYIFLQVFTLSSSTWHHHGDVVHVSRLQQRVCFHCLVAVCLSLFVSLTSLFCVCLFMCEVCHDWLQYK